VRHRIIVLAMTLVTFGTSLWAFQFIPQNFFPQSSRPEILVDLWLPEGTSIKEVEAQAKALEAKMMDDKDKKFIATYIGEGAPRFFLPLDQQLRNPNYAQLLVMANDEPARERLIVKLRGILAEDFPSTSAARSTACSSARRPAGRCRCASWVPDRQEVRKIADQVKAKFREDPLLGAIHDDWLEPVPAMKLVIDQDRARALGVTSQRVRQMLQAAMSGAPLDDFRDGEETVSIVAREPDANRSACCRPSTRSISPPISAASCRCRRSPRWCRCWSRASSGAATACRPSRCARRCPMAVQPNDVVMKLYKPTCKPLRDSLPAGYKIEIQGGAEDAAESQASIAAKAPIMLARHRRAADDPAAALRQGDAGAGHRSARHHRRRCGTFDQRRAVRLRGHPRRHRAARHHHPQLDHPRRPDRPGHRGGHGPQEAIVGAAVRRFRPIMLTAMTAVLALIPISRGVFWGPLAYAMMGGILVATVLTILVLPAAYALFFGKEPKEEGEDTSLPSNSNDEEIDRRQPPVMAAE
jgi:multidrug efflux pump